MEAAGGKLAILVELVGRGQVTPEASGSGRADA